MEQLKAHPKNRLFSIFVALVLVLPLVAALGSAPAHAQTGSRTFPETGKTVKGKFLDYWTRNGGLEQQGFPISEEMQERNETDGKTYTVQYFERAIFELHPENQPPYDVLLSLLGVFLYKEKYPTGAPNQEPNIEIGREEFKQTGKWVGGRFLNYWKSHGGLAQQGLPISDEFLEKNQLDGKTYKVQYFERAVFEYHPENAGGRFEVLLSQLGKFRYDKVHGGAPKPPTVVPSTPGAPNPTAVPPTSTPTGGRPPCGATQNNRNGEAQPSSVTNGDTILFSARGFQGGEPISFWFTYPDGDVIGTEAGVEGLVAPNGTVRLEDIVNEFYTDWPGTWAFTIQGDRSGNVAVIYFCVYQ
jgi:hypothetical protein